MPIVLAKEPNACTGTGTESGWTRVLLLSIWRIRWCLVYLRMHRAKSQRKSIDGSERAATSLPCTNTGGSFAGHEGTRRASVGSPAAVPEMVL